MTNQKIKKENVYLICYNRLFPNRGKVGKIVGVKKIHIDNDTENVFSNTTSKLAYHIAFEDGNEHYVFFDLIEQDDWHFVTLEELLCVGMPK